MARNIETLRKIVMTGLGAALMTEESLSKLIAEVKLPRDAKKYLIAQAQKRKSDIANILAKELKDFLSRVNIHEELHKALTGLKIDVTATVEVDRHGPSVKVTRVRTNKGSKKRVTRRKKPITAA